MGGRRIRISEFEASLVYKVSSRTARAIPKKPCQEKKRKEKKRREEKRREEKRREERKGKKEREREKERKWMLTVIYWMEHRVPNEGATESTQGDEEVCSLIGGTTI